MDPSTRKRPREDIHRDRCEALVKKLWQQDALRMFHFPVTEEAAPGYHEIITDPTDLTTIKSKLAQGGFTSDRDFLQEVRRMLSNALEFNARGDAWYVQARQMQKTLRATIEACGLKKYDVDENDSDGEFVPKGIVLDKEATIEKEEKKTKENVGELLQTLQDDLEIPLEELKARYLQRASNVEVSDEDDDDDDDSSSSDGDDESDDEEDSDEESTDEEDETSASGEA